MSIRQKKPEDLLYAAQQAQIVLQSLRPETNSLRSKALARLKSAYREGNLTLEIALACVAELVTLDDLESKFERAIKSSHSAADKVYNKAVTKEI